MSSSETRPSFTSKHVQMLAAAALNAAGPLHAAIVELAATCQQPDDRLFGVAGDIGQQLQTVSVHRLSIRSLRRLVRTIPAPHESIRGP